MRTNARDNGSSLHKGIPLVGSNSGVHAAGAWQSCPSVQGPVAPQLHVKRLLSLLFWAAIVSHGLRDTW